MQQVDQAYSRKLLQNSIIDNFICHPRTTRALL